MKKPVAYYNEIDPYAAEWLRNLILMGHIAYGVVDTRSITDIEPNELKDFTQCHFFAGIGVWSHALRLAGWPDDRPVWTGSCPCQPFSVAGAGAGFADERHLWPHWFWLISQCRPETVFGEQVASKDGLSWLDLVCTDMEGEGYAIAPVDLCAAGVGAPHIRQRLYFVADTDSQRLQGEWPDHDSQRWQRQDFRQTGLCGGTGFVITDGSTGPTNGHWSADDWLRCRDDKWRPVEPGTFPLANEASARVGRLRAYGNAIVPQVAAQVIGAYLDVRG